MTRPKMNPHLIIYLLSGVVSLASATSDTLCEALEQHRYSDMGILSITFNLYGLGMVIFTRPAFRAYKLDRYQITQHSMDLSQVTPINMEASRYHTAFSPVQHQTHRGTYIFSLFNLWEFSIYKLKIIFLIVTDKGVRSGSYLKNYGHFIEVAEPDGRELPDFTLAGMGWDWSKDLSGYVLSEDSTRPGTIILSEYNVFWDDSKVTGLPPPKGETDERPVFFIQVTDSPGEVRLVPSSSNSPDAEAQLLSTVPRAFLYDKTHLVLFDTINGCVHIIADFAGFRVTQTEWRTFRRENIPFEVYFQCGKHIEDPNPNRCNFVRGSQRPTINPPENPPEDVGSLSLGVTISVCLVLAVLSVGLLYTVMVQKKKTGKGTVFGKSGVKASATSSSAFSGTSKTRSKPMSSPSSFSGYSTAGYSWVFGHGAQSKFNTKVANTSKTPRGATTTWGPQTSKGAKTPRGLQTSKGAKTSRGAKTPRGHQTSRGLQTSKGAKTPRDAKTPRGHQTSRGAKISRGATISTAGSIRTGSFASFAKTPKFAKTLKFARTPKGAKTPK